MKITIASDTLFPHQVNGVAKVAARSAELLRMRGHEVQVVSAGDAPSLPFWGYSGERLVLPTGQVYRHILAFEPDVIHAHTPFVVGREAARAAKSLGVPFVGTHHTFLDHYLKHVHLDSKLTRRLSWSFVATYYDMCDVVLSPSRALAEGLSDYGLKKQVRILQNGIDIQFLTPTGASPGFAPSAVYMGRLSYEKSIDVVVEAFALLLDELPDAQLTLIGDGPERSALEAQVRKSGLEGSVVFTGMLHGEALRDTLRRQDIFVTGAKTENMPLSVLEAMAVGLPVVGVDALGIPEIVTDKVSGIIVSPDDVKAFAAAMLTLLRDNELRQKYAEEARRAALTYSEEAHAAALESLYNSLIQ